MTYCYTCISYRICIHVILFFVALKLLTADTISKWGPFESLQKLSLGIDLRKLHLTTCALQLIKSCPNLSIIQIFLSIENYNVIIT